ncbi:APC membrane recruitment protein 1 isoform X1 [Cygnus olor]|uniref:APC membrane recruitment protein 1 isoform X1 n=1 Tax=Cygnus olor TaxID=8869 RepID=UPI001ADE0A4C|nr:APC membrane recruitment protein 1 isoform X1 [Cygnus olor]
MEAACTEESARSRSQSAVCRQRKGSDQQPEENGERLSQWSDASVAAAEQQQQPQAPPGKLKKTAFKLFGGKRSICTLPSFFGGRNKGQGKGASKKGLSKSKTHDGISGAVYDEGSRVQLESPSDGSKDSHPCPLPSSQSVHVAIDTSVKFDFGRQDGSPPGSIEGCEKKPNGDKSSFPRPKKGLKGLLNSIRRHRKSKVAECEKAELPEWTGDSEEANKARGTGTETQGATEERGPGSVPLAAACPGNSEDNCSVGTTTNSGEAAEPDWLRADQGSPEGDGVAMPGDQDALDAKSEVDAAVCAESDYSHLPVALHPDLADNDPPSLHSGDQLSLIFGDVTSLKSFDSLTGCGDIIAEPDILSIAESAISVERSRDAAKRSSCLVTYQGGGEEMAMPEEAEEYLQQMWDSTTEGDGSYEAQLPPAMSGRDPQAASSKLETRGLHEAEAHPYAGGAMDGVELLTPQSDQQESAPNSDEGYYDSTTPGPEDEGGDGLCEIKKDRLPRDSYSGDALYEFYEPDDTLMSPSHGEESLFESKVSRPEIFSYFLDFCLPAEKGLIQMMDQKMGVMETEEERLAAIQKELLYWELQREPVLKRLDVPREKQYLECKTRAASLIGKNQSCLGSEQIASQAPNRSVSSGVSVARGENPEWRDFPGPLCPENCYNSQKAQGSCLIQLMKNNPGFNSDPDQALFGGPVHGGVAPPKTGPFPGYRPHERESCSQSDRRDGAEAAPREPQADSECEPEHAVNFSQALVEFTSSGTLFSSLSESLGSSDSGSSFTQNLPVLPTMVTFDIVDVEQEGEGECEQHLEMNADEDIAASFEAFDDSYVQKESFAECDERMFPGYPQGSFQSCNWGVASLPRHLRLHGLSPAMPAPLSVNRRSRSLDTESLEFELADLQVSKNGLKPCQLWSKRDKKDLDGARRSRSKEDAGLSVPAGGEADSVLGWPGLQHLQYDAELAPGGVKRWGFAPAAGLESGWEPSEQPDADSPFLSLSRSSAREALERRPQEPELDRQLVRPSNLPLQADTRQPLEAPGAYRYHGEVAAKKLARVLPLGEPEPPQSFGFAQSPEKPAKCKPVGVAQGVPQFHDDSTETLKSPSCFVEHFGSAGKELLKGRGTQGSALPAGCPSAAVNVTGAK